MKRFILYLAAVFLTVYMAVIYKSRILTALAAIEVLIPLPVMILGFITARLLRVELSVPAEAVSRNDPVKVLLSVENRSVFPMVYGIAGIQCQNRFRKLKASRNILIQAPGRRKIEYLCQWTSQHCGTLDFSLKYLKVHDYLHLMVFRVRLDQSAEAAVLPVPVHVEVPLEHRNPISEDGEKYDPHKSGDDPSEVFDIREYRQGDRLSRIHWKMTAKEEELMVKEYSRPLGGEGILCLDLYHPQADGFWEDADEYLDLLDSLCLAFLERGERFRVVWQEGESQGLREQSVESEEDVYGLLGSLFRARPYKTEFSVEERFTEQCPQAAPSFLYRLDLKGKLWEGGTLLWEKSRTDPYS